VRVLGADVSLHRAPLALHLVEGDVLFLLFMRACRSPSLLSHQLRLMQTLATLRYSCAGTNGPNTASDATCYTSNGGGCVNGPPGAFTGAHNCTIEYLQSTTLMGSGGRSCAVGPVCCTVGSPCDVFRPWDGLNNEFGGSFPGEVSGWLVNPDGPGANNIGPMVWISTRGTDGSAWQICSSNAVSSSSQQYDQPCFARPHDRNALEHDCTIAMHCFVSSTRHGSSSDIIARPTTYLDQFLEL
jgi:hypothetical protein